MNRPLTSLTLLLPSVLLVAGCSPGYYRESADRQVYQILRDRKYAPAGSNPQPVVGSAAIREGGGATGGPEMARQEGEEAKSRVVPAPGTSAQPVRAYDPIPVTQLPPLEVPPLEAPPAAGAWE